MTLEKLISGYLELLNEHRAWLGNFNKARLEKWEKLLQASAEGAQAAICEAATRKLISEQYVEVEPYEDLSSGGPDFLCIKNNKNFYIETTCLTKDAIAKATGFNKIPRPGLHGGPFSLPTGKIFYEMCNKTPQLRNLGAPCILAIGTLHVAVGHICFSKIFASHILTGTPKISVRIDPEQWQAISELHQTTELLDSGFIRPNKISTNLIEDARRTISAVLLCSFGTTPRRAIGLLHPNSNYRFDRTLLPKIEFCKLVKDYKTGDLKIEWI